MSDFQSHLGETSLRASLPQPPMSMPGPRVLGTTAGAMEDSQRSWVFEIIDFVSWLFSRLFGIISIIFLLAVTANIPILQFLSLGYLLEVTGRIARGQKLRSVFIGLEKASRLGSVVLGAWLCLLPVRFASQLSLEAYLIDPHSPQTQFMRRLVIVMIVLTVAHVAAAWFCGGRLRYFFWPVVAPFSFMIWMARRFAGSNFFRRLLGITVGWLSPHLVDNICNAKPIEDWFLPAILWKKIRQRGAYQAARDGLWNFFSQLNLGYYFKLGVLGFIGTALWLVIPTGLLVGSTSLSGAGAVLTGLVGSLIAIPVFSILPFLQAHFAVDGNLRRFLQVGTVLKNVGKAPVSHVIALLLTLLFALPLFLLKIEEIPAELLWTLSIVFVIFTWPAKVITGWAYAQGTRQEKPHRWWIRYPILTLAVPICLAFVFVLFFTRYITWNGAFSLIENHVFLLPAPFWLFS
jgi:hypothetical protein